MRRVILLLLALSLFVVAMTGLVLWRLEIHPDSTPLILTPATQPAIVIGYAAPEWNGGQFLIMQSFRRHAEKRGWTVKPMNANFDSATQAQQVRYLLDHGASAIVAVPIDSDKIAPSIELAHTRGVRFYTIDRAPTTGRADMIVQSDNLLAGRQAGEAMAAALQAKYGSVRGLVLELQGELTQNVARARRDGFHAAFAQHPGVTIISRETHWQGQAFAQHAREVLGEMSVDGIYLHSDMIGVIEVLPVLKQAGRLHPSTDGRHIIITGVDGSPPALKAIRDGFVDSVASQPIADYGIITDWIAAGFRGEPVVPGEVTRRGMAWSPATLTDTPNGPLLQLRTLLVNKSNADEAYLWGNQVDTAPGRSP